MNYKSSVSDFFKSPKWKMNALLGAVAILIPIVGQLVLSGWHTTILWSSRDDKDPADYSPFNFESFGKFLERGVWPFLVNLVASFVMIPVMLCVMIPLFVFMGVFESGHQQASGAHFAIFFAGLLIFQFGLMLLYQFLVTPLMIRAIIMQDFAPAFNPAFVKDFISRVRNEMLGTMFFLFGLGFCMMVFTIITCYIGMLFAMPLVMFSWHHLQKQLYQLYLSRGGIAVPMSHKLIDAPPPLPMG